MRNRFIGENHVFKGLKGYPIIPPSRNMGMYMEMRITATRRPTNMIRAGSRSEPMRRIWYSSSSVRASPWRRSISGRRLVSSPTRTRAVSLRSYSAGKRATQAEKSSPCSRPRQIEANDCR